MKDVEIRFAQESDKDYLIKWLNEPGILSWFPMCNQIEVEDAARIWISYSKYKAVLTATYKGEPCGIANLYLQPYVKLAHQSLFAIILGDEYRNKGIGTLLMEELIKLARDRFKLEMLHLEVYEGNPAIHLYERLGFIKYGVHKKFLKETNGTYVDKNMMYKILK